MARARRRTAFDPVLCASILFPALPRAAVAATTGYGVCIALPSARRAEVLLAFHPLPPQPNAATVARHRQRNTTLAPAESCQRASGQDGRGSGVSRRAAAP
ncbi:hypothetical protein M432DRAFT_639678 [Thermoascus aurantiacus ATCC 26904]